MDIIITSPFGWLLCFLFGLDLLCGLAKIHIMRQQSRNTNTKLAMSALRQSLQADPQYAYSWYVNLSLSLDEAMESGTRELKLKESKAAARSFMNKTFGVVIPE